MKAAKIYGLILFSLCLAPAARAQFVSVSVGRLFPQSLAAPTTAVSPWFALPARSDFSPSAIIAVDAGIGVLPFLGAGLHYSYSRPELILRRSDAFGSSARVDLGANTLTFDARVHSPYAFGFRAYGFAGAGFTRFALNVKNRVEVPFPSGTPGDITSPVFTYGGGLEKKLTRLLRAKLEVRDYLTPISDKLFQPGGAWHRVAVVGGIVLGK